MKRIRFSTEINYIPEGLIFYPGIDYILPEATVAELEERYKRNGYEVFELKTPFVEGFDFIQWQYPEAPRKLLFYVTGRIGDTIMHTAIVHRIKQLFPSCEIDVVTRYDSIYHHNPDIRTTKIEPFIWTPITNEEYDATIFIDDLVANMRNADQPSAFEALHAALNLPFVKHLTTPKIHLKRDDEIRATMTLAKIPDERGEVYETSLHLVLGLHSSSETRDIPKEKWAEIASYYAKKYGKEIGEHFTIYGISDSAKADYIHDAIFAAGVKNYVPVHSLLDFRALASLIRRAICVISVDTSIVHMAAAVGSPCVALMTTVPPNKRLDCYPLAVGLWNPSACDFAPCYWKGDEFIKTIANVVEYAPCYTAEKKYCNCGLGFKIGDIDRALEIVTDARWRIDEYNFPKLPVK